MVFSELAFDDDLFIRRYLEREVFYYARERSDDEQHRVHYIAVDASASMRGQRNVFARGLALTLLKKMLHEALSNGLHLDVLAIVCMKKILDPTDRTGIWETLHDLTTSTQS